MAALVIVACASIDPPATFTPNEAGTGPSSSDPRGCRRLPRTFTANGPARLYTLASGAQAVCIDLQLDVKGAATGLVTFCVAGRSLDSPSIRQIPREIGLDRQRCAYCVDVQTNCPTNDGGISGPCGTSYAPTAGKVRIVKLGVNVGEEVWVDVGALTAARIENSDPDAGTYELEPADCLSADGLTFQGTLVAATCTDASTECRIVNSADDRFP